MKLAMPMHGYAFRFSVAHAHYEKLATGAYGRMAAPMRGSLLINGDCPSFIYMFCGLDFGQRVKNNSGGHFKFTIETEQVEHHKSSEVDEALSPYAFNMLKSMLKDYKVCGVSIFVRLLSVYVVDSFFVPDEYYQSVEIAHHMVYGYGYLTWEWTQGIRSYIYPPNHRVPLLFAAFTEIGLLLSVASGVFPAHYSSCSELLRRFGLLLVDRVELLGVLLPGHVVVLVFHRIADVNKHCGMLSDHSDNQAVSVARVGYRPIQFSLHGHRGIAIRNETYGCHILHPADPLPPGDEPEYHQENHVGFLLAGWVLVGSIVIDSLAHGSFVVTPYEFIKVNFFKDIGSFTGCTPGTVVLGVQVIPFVLGLIKFVRNREAYHKELVILGSMAFTVAVYSYMPHKEFRFLLPLLPLAMYIASKYLSIWSRTASRWEVWTVVIFMLVGNAIPAVYFSMVHQTGPMNIIRALRPMLYDCPEDTSLLFLMPCHSTPMYSHLHKNVSVRMLTCEPNFDNLPGYKDESAIFYECPHCWIDENYPNIKSMPTYIITYKGFDMRIINRLGSYDPVFRTFHSHLPDPRREGRDMIIYRKEYYILR
ncbi:hypothetical protein NQ318_012368 [Aromia moschata]|uniref:Mannosyltransferase n=1 Tax=Aromia moschata TaxID=1265417 RepID=A0AAV8Y2L8_9CUCU|nr:hypothetical protein NQ318_012368 [Aromia moschata]